MKITSHRTHKIHQVKLRGRTLPAVLGVVIIASIGSILLVISRAVTPTASVEPENGTLTSPVTAVSDTTASGGKYAKFGAASTGGTGASAANPSASSAAPAQWNHAAVLTFEHNTE